MLQSIKPLMKNVMSLLACACFGACVIFALILAV
jgi:hypothetical protein